MKKEISMLKLNKDFKVMAKSVINERNSYIYEIKKFKWQQLYILSLK